MSDRLIGVDRPVFIIAEIGVNHMLDPADLERLGVDNYMDVAKRMIDEAVKAGVDAVKFQSFTAETLQFQGTGKPGYAVINVGDDDEINYFDMIKRYEMSHDEQRELARYATSGGVVFFATPYDSESADFLDKDLDVPVFKLASFELNNHLLIRHVARKGKPLILSTGLSDMDEVRETVRFLRAEGFVDQVTLMQCTSDYPTDPADVNLNVLRTYAMEFPDLRLGLSDHCESITASLGGVALGALALEKHFTLDRSLAGPDHRASLDPDGLRRWVAAVREMEACMGTFEKRVTKAERKNRTMRRYLVVEPSPAGSVLRQETLTSMRAGHGIPATDANLKRIIGRKLIRDVLEKERFQWEMVGGEGP